MSRISNYCYILVFALIFTAATVFASDEAVDDCANLPADNGFQDHEIIKLNGYANSEQYPAQFRLLSENWNAQVYVPGLTYLEDKNRVLLLMSTCGTNRRSLLMESDDLGQTWTKPHFLLNTERIPEVSGIGITTLGGSKVFLYRGYNRALSNDYGETWQTVSKLDPPEGKPAWDLWDPPLVVRKENNTIVYETGHYADVLDNGGYHSQAYIRWTIGRDGEFPDLTSWSKPIKVPQWDYINEVFLAQAPDGNLVAACRTDNRTWWLDQVSGLQTTVSSDGGQTWSEPFVVSEASGMHPDIVTLPDGRLVMTYAIRRGYPYNEYGFPRFRIEAVISNDNGKTWDLDGRYILMKYDSQIAGDLDYNAAPQSTATILLPNGQLMTAFGLGYSYHRDIALMLWSVPPAREVTARDKATELVRKYQLDRTFWDNEKRYVYGESLLFVKKGDQPASARTLYIPGSYTRLMSSDRKKTYMEDVDYIVNQDEKTLILTEKSSIPFLTADELAAKSENANVKAHGNIENKTESVGINADFIESHQVVLDYVPPWRDYLDSKTCNPESPDRWTGYVPVFDETRLPKILEKLRNGKSVHLVVSGDGISAERVKSESTDSKSQPFQPCWPELVAMGLQSIYGSEVTLDNFMTEGRTSQSGADDLKRIIDAKPDLLVLASGMFDIRDNISENYHSNLKTLIESVREKLPDCEFILVSSMPVGPEGGEPSQEQFSAYAKIVQDVADQVPGTAFADMTTLGQDLLKRKSFYDICGSGGNQPNEFGHRLYAQVVLSLLTEGSLDHVLQKNFLDALAYGLPEPEGPSTVIPTVPRWANGDVKWKERLERLKQEISAGGDLDLLLIGDSITHLWTWDVPNDANNISGENIWNKYFKKYKSINFGFSGDRTETMLWRLGEVPLEQINPKVISLLIGANNVTNLDTPPQDIVKGILAVLDRLQKTFPNAEVILMPIFPRDENRDEIYRKRVSEVNNELIPAVADREHTHLLDLTDTFLESDGHLPKDIMFDFLHPTEKGFERWAEKLEPLVNQLLNGEPAK
ncbi:MAG: GDSL-type esterase/lipase family protein [Planctomycetia bacterium]|nr:GDSL-type esterase/lipase family protein [Planctomycetia bacterium]